MEARMWLTDESALLTRESMEALGVMGSERTPLVVKELFDKISSVCAGQHKAAALLALQMALVTVSDGLEEAAERAGRN